MTDSKFDYKNCSYHDLIDIKNHIDKEKYSDRYNEVCSLLEKIEKPIDRKLVEKKVVRLTNSDYIFCGIFSFLLVAYQIWNEETIGRPSGFLLHENPAMFWFFNIMLLVAGIINFVSLFINLYRSKNA